MNRSDLGLDAPLQAFLRSAGRGDWETVAQRLATGVDLVAFTNAGGELHELADRMYEDRRWDLIEQLAAVAIKDGVPFRSDPMWNLVRGDDLPSEAARLVAMGFTPEDALVLPYSSGQSADIFLWYIDAYPALASEQLARAHRNGEIGEWLSAARLAGPAAYAFLKQELGVGSAVALVAQVGTRPYERLWLDILEADSLQQAAQALEAGWVPPNQVSVRQIMDRRPGQSSDAKVPFVFALVAKRADELLKAWMKAPALASEIAAAFAQDPESGWRAAALGDMRVVDLEFLREVGFPLTAVTSEGRNLAHFLCESSRRKAVLNWMLTEVPELLSGADGQGRTPVALFPATPKRQALRAHVEKQILDKGVGHGAKPSAPRI